jgi:hypothetical protein
MGDGRVGNVYQRIPPAVVRFRHYNPQKTRVGA